MTHEIPTNGSLPENSLQFSPKILSGKRIGLGLICLSLLAGLGFLSTHNTVAQTKSGRAKNQGSQVTPVTVATATQRAVPIQLQAIGTVQSWATVSVTPQVGGRITGVYFKRGQDVKKGQLLVTIDDRTELAAVQQAEGTLARDLAQVQQAQATKNKDLTVVRQAQANLAKDKAQQQFTTAEANRYDTLFNQGAVSKEQAQQYSSNNGAQLATLDADKQAIANAQAAVQVDDAAIKNAQGVVAADQAALDSAKVQLSYTKIYSPIDGRVGNILVDAGNVVAANSSNPLVVIAQIHPIQVSFAVPEANLPEIQKYMSNNKLTVNVTFPNSNTLPIPGVLTFVNNTIDNTTGTIQLLGSFDNDQGQLWPGQYVNTTLTLTTQPNATVVPSQAVQTGTNGQFVFVLKPDSTVQNVPVTTGSTINGLTVVKNGIQPGTQIVTDGQANLVSGNKVQIKQAGGSGNGGTRGQGDKGTRGVS
jgi:multidrug efflux system membrane fusion protein